MAPVPAAPALSLDALLDDAPKDPAAIKAARKKVDKARAAREAEEVWNMSLAALGAGIVALGLFWIPFVGPAAGMIATGIGVATLFRASRRRDLPMGVATSGTIIGFAAMFIGGAWTIHTQLAATTPDDSAQVAQAAAPTNPAAVSAEDDTAKSARTAASSSAKVPAKSNAPAVTKLPDAAAAKSSKNTSSQTPADATAPKAGGPRNAIGGTANGSGSSPLPKSATGGTKSASAPKTPGAQKNAKTPAGNGAKSPAGAVAVKTPADDKTKKSPLAPGDSGLRFQGPVDQGTTATPDGSADNKTGGKEPVAPVSTEIRWAAADKGETPGVGDVKDRVDHVVLGSVAFEDKEPTKLLGGSIRKTPESNLTIWLTIKNGQEAGERRIQKLVLVGTDASLADDQARLRAGQLR